MPVECRAEVDLISVRFSVGDRSQTKQGRARCQTKSKRGNQRRIANNFQRLLRKSIFVTAACLGGGEIFGEVVAGAGPRTQGDTPVGRR